MKHETPASKGLDLFYKGCWLLLFLLPPVVSCWKIRSPRFPQAANKGLPSRVQAGMAAMTVPFVENAGQSDPQVAYYVRTFGGTVFVTRQGQMVYSLPAPPASQMVLTETFLGGKVPLPHGEEPSPVGVSSFRGDDPATWRSRLATYGAVNLGEVYEKIQISLRAQGHSVEKLFRVLPQGDPSLIELGVDGAEGLRVETNGELAVETSLGEVRFTKPVAYQEVAGARREVPVAYRVSDRS